jgi:hypothetical protein
MMSFQPRKHAVESVVAPFPFTFRSLVFFQAAYMEQDGKT